MFKHASIYVIATIITNALGILSIPIYTRYLSPADFGILALFMVFGSVSTGLISLGLFSATYRFFFQLKNDRESFKVLNFTNLVVNLVLFITLGIIIYQFSTWISNFFFDRKLAEDLILISFINGCIVYFVRYLCYLLSAADRSIAFAVITISQSVFGHAISMILIFKCSWTYLARMYGSLLSGMIILIVLLILNKKYVKPGLSFSFFKKSLMYSYPQIPGSIINILYASLDKMMINKFNNLSMLGYYEFGNRFGSLIKLFMDAVGNSWTPFFFRKAEEFTDSAKVDIAMRFNELSFLYLFLGLGTIFFSEELIILLTTKEYYPSMYIVPLIVIYYLTGDLMGSLSHNQISFAEKLIYKLPAAIVAIVVNIIFNLLLIPQYGAIGAAVATIIASLGSSIILSYFGFKLYPLPLKIRPLAVVLIIFIIMTIFYYLLLASDMTILMKISIKVVLLGAFLIFGFKLKLVPYEKISYLRRAL